MQKILQTILKVLAKLTLWRYRPRIIGITGSVGKTTTREAVYAVLSAKFRVYRSDKNYNNEIGLPLVILGFQTQGKNILGWIRVFVLSAWQLIYNYKFPEIIILEMGVDHPGDMDYLLSIVRPDIGIVTNIGKSHLEFFSTQLNIKKEKGKLIQAINKDGLSILNRDDGFFDSINILSKAKVVSFGFEKEKSDFSVDSIKISHSGDSYGTSFKIFHKGSSVPIFLPRAVGSGAVYSAMTAVCVGINLGMNLLEISESLKNFKLPKGRLNLIAGLKDSLLIDDSYNASPQSTLSSLECMKDISEGRRTLFFIGDMLELGKYSEDGHREIGKKAKELGVSLLIAVGDMAEYILEGARKAGMPKSKMLLFSNSREASKEIVNLVNDNDIILIKGSQGARMERISKALLRDKSRVMNLLVRQSEEWLD